MAKPSGFLDYKRSDVAHRPVTERVGDYFEIDIPHPESVLIEQAARCMDCGIPFCHGAGCPLGNRIPEFNDLVYRGKWRDAAENLHSTNNFPEITGRLCPALCEPACSLSVNDDPVLIRHIEYQIAERAFDEGWVVPLAAQKRTGQRVAVVGSGPAGLAAAQQLARIGHDVVVFEKDEKIGGLLRYGIPNFKLNKAVIDRRLEQLAGEGVEFQTRVSAGEDISGKYLRNTFDAICLTMGAGQPRDLQVEGRQLKNVHFAMEYLAQQNKIVSGSQPDKGKLITAQGKIVAVIGGGDTGSDCVGSARRQGAKQIHQLEIMPKPAETRPDATPWPSWPNILRSSSSHEEGCERRWSVQTSKLTGSGEEVHELIGCEVDWTAGDKGWQMTVRPGSEFTMKVDLVLLAMGFVHVAHGGLVDQLGLALDQRGNLLVDSQYMTSLEGVFAAGDAAEGPSLIVRAIHAGREAAAATDLWLKNR